MGKIARNISLDVTLDIEEIFEGFENILRKCNDLERNEICSEFVSFRIQVEYFEKLVKGRKRLFQNSILPILPKIRGGGKEEKALNDVITNLKQSPFNANS